MLKYAELNGTIQAGMYVEPDTLELHIRFLNKYFNIIPLNEFISGELTRKSLRDNRPLCVITFDDGWHDFYKYVYPLLLAYKVPATVYLPTEFIGTNNWFWSDRLAWLIAHKVDITKSLLQRYSSQNPLLRMIINTKGSLSFKQEKAIEISKQFSNEIIEEAIAEFAELIGALHFEPKRAFLSWEEVREMFQSKLITFGSHTAGHKILTNLRESEIRQELEISMDKLISEQIVDHSSISFCYPNGNYDNKTALMVQEVGYSSAVTTKDGWNNKHSDFYKLNRVSIHQDMTLSGPMLSCRIVGLI